MDKCEAVPSEVASVGPRSASSTRIRAGLAPGRWVNIVARYSTKWWGSDSAGCSISDDNIECCLQIQVHHPLPRNGKSIGRFWPDCGQITSLWPRLANIKPYHMIEAFRESHALAELGPSVSSASNSPPSVQASLESWSDRKSHRLLAGSSLDVHPRWPGPGGGHCAALLQARPHEEPAANPTRMPPGSCERMHQDTRPQRMYATRCRNNTNRECVKTPRTPPQSPKIPTDAATRAREGLKSPAKRATKMPTTRPTFRGRQDDAKRPQRGPKTPLIGSRGFRRCEGDFTRMGATGTMRREESECVIHGPKRRLAVYGCCASFTEKGGQPGSQGAFD